MAVDIFDVYDEHPEVVAVPVAQAIQDFQNHWDSHQAFFRADEEELRAGSSTAISRKERWDHWQALTAKVELRLFRSIRAARA